MIAGPNDQKISPAGFAYSNIDRAAKGAARNSGIMRNAIVRARICVTGRSKSSSISAMPADMTSIDRINGVVIRIRDSTCVTGFTNSIKRLGRVGSVAECSAFSSKVASDEAWPASSVGIVGASDEFAPSGATPTLPRSMTFCPIASTKAGSCVIETSVVPRACARRSNLTNSSHVVRSWPNVGSSRISNSGALISALATESRRFSPPDRVIGFAPASAVRPSAARCSSTRPANSSPSIPS